MSILSPFLSISDQFQLLTSYWLNVYQCLTIPEAWNHLVTLYVIHAVLYTQQFSGISFYGQWKVFSAVKIKQNFHQIKLYSYTVGNSVGDQ